jgi:F0F1-type ATP synthase assembly protein I
MTKDPGQADRDELHETEHEVWKDPPPPPPMPDFPKIPQSLRDAAGQKQPDKFNLAGIGAGWALALDFVGTILASWLIGFGIDWWRKTSPWGTLIGLGFGFGYAIYRILRQSQKEEKKDRK